MAKGRHIVYSKQELSWLEKNCTLVISEYTKQFNSLFKRSISKQNLHALRKRKGWRTGRTGRFVKGQKSWNKGTKGLTSVNKTSFKKGNIPHNHKPIGHERTTKDGAVMIKVAEPNKFRLKNRVVWEEHNGEIPEGMVVLSRNGDPSDCRIENLTLFSRAELARLNRKGHKNAPEEIQPVLRTLARLEATIYAKEHQ